MLSVIIPVRNTREFASICLQSAARTFATLAEKTEAGTAGFEFILIDDNSKASSGIIELFQQFRSSVPFKTTIARLKERKYYTYAVSLGLSLARGEEMLLISHDMIVTPAYVRWVRQAAQSDSTVGIVRGCSGHIDLFPQHQVRPVLPLRNYDDVCSFSQYVARYYQGTVEEDRFLIGDSFLVKRAVIDRIGVMDPSYVHLFGDVDFGLRAQRAGFKIVCAKGAWLHHEGNAHTKNLLASGVSVEDLQSEAAKLVAGAYSVFRKRWDVGLPDLCGAVAEFDFEGMRKKAVEFDERVALLKVDEKVWELM